jgi:hypothetical protein
MAHASSKDALKRVLAGIAQEIQANDLNDLEYEVVMDKVDRNWIKP